MNTENCSQDACNYDSKGPEFVPAIPAHWKKEKILFRTKLFRKLGCDETL